MSDDNHVEKARQDRLFTQLVVALKNWVPDGELLLREQTHYVSQLTVVGRPTHVWLLKAGGYYNGESRLAGFHVNHGYSHIALSPCPGDDVASLFAHELFHCVHWNTNNYEQLSTEGAALMAEHTFRLLASSNVLTELSQFEFDERGTTHEP